MLNDQFFQQGSTNRNSILDEAKVAAILRSNKPHDVLGLRYGVKPVTIRQIRRGYAWRHVARPAGFTYLARWDRTKKRATPE